ncbi:MAG TPA: helix-turn-helix domain-containing protein [Balneolaceae bacterium]|nr:helix-turn-helix domain-containing protein [Balneolaceae bacterium]
MTYKEEIKLHIKNMVCPRCITVVRETLEDIGFTVREVELGKAVVNDEPGISISTVDEQLQKHGFELIQGKDQQLVEQIKTLLIQYVQELEESDEVPKLSDYLTDQLHQNYSSLSSSFSQSEDITLEKYLIHLKIERVKELLSYNELTLSEIAYKLSYSSVSHLSNQFKQITGMSVTDYKKAKDSFRRPLDGIE